MAPRRRKRLEPATFNLPVERLRQGGSGDGSALRVRDILLQTQPDTRATVQITSEDACVLGGTDESVALLKLCAGDWNSLVVHSLYDGDHAEPGDTVMTLEGPYATFVALETAILGTLARRSRVSTNARAFVEAARPKLVMAFPARHDHWMLQPGDAVAAQIGGALTISVGPAIAGPGRQPTPVPPLALLPHALIGAYGGDTRAAAQAFAAQVTGRDASPGGPETEPPPGAAPGTPPAGTSIGAAAAGPPVPGRDVQVVVPVDYDNDAVATALLVARALEGQLWGVQLATSQNLVDVSIIPVMGTFPPTGVNPNLVWNVRNALDAEGFGDIKILASSGMTLDRIQQFEEEGVPVDAYGIGAALLAGRTGFTAALVQLDRPLRLRVGSELRPNPRLERVK
jgi:nicotinate phosphoribosyltransferase